ncbi:hypothetical protein EMPS_07186 [Entomortierella parvispora]|uniref:Uncharacterized protein n=1 Tax=Entomortierella parvispora TaxID=205924 RepID=A0A9P3LY74_9FUNG|nr:hypothetical protein EMPS_07186 [Entomortierella parvispora]
MTQNDAAAMASSDLPYRPEETDYDEFDKHDEVVKPRAAPFYKRKRFWIFCAVITVVLVAILVPVILFLILPKVAQKIVNNSSLSFQNIVITEPTNTTMTMELKGSLGNAGPFHATVSYPETIKVFYNGTLLGEMDPLPDTKASGGSGTVEGKSRFTIADEAAFSAFSKNMLGDKSFTWSLQSTVTIRAMGRTIENLKLNKEISLLGMNGFPEVEILSFNLPSDAPNGQGINLEMSTAMHNPSPIGIALGTIVLDISFQGTRLGQVRANGASLQGGSQSILNLTGIMEPQTTPEGLEKVSSLFSAYIAGIACDTTAKGVSVLPNGLDRVSWLSAGLEAMVLNVKLQSPIPLNIIRSTELGPMGMNWTNTDAYAPLATSPQVIAGFQMPFGFSLNVSQVQNNMTVVYQNKTLATVNALDWGLATTVKDGDSSAIHFALPPTPFNIGQDAHADFDAFVKDLTIKNAQGFQVEGVAGTVAQTPIGEVRITGIPFKSDVSLTGLQGLATEPTVIHNLTVIGGIPQGLQIALDMTMVNPSSLTIATGPGSQGLVTFDMIYQGDNVGSVLLEDLTLVPGPNRRNAGALFTPSSSAGGQALLQSYMTNQISVVDVQGSISSSAIAPLANGLKEIHIQSNMPGNPAQLLLGTSLTILSETTSNGVAMTSVVVNNPFLPQLTIKAIKSSVKYHNATLGAIDIPDMTFVVPSMSSATSTPLPITMDLSIPSLLGLIITQAQLNGMNPAPITALGQMVADPTFKPDAALFANFNLPAFVKAAMVGLKVDVEMSVNVLVGEYATSMTLAQNTVPTATDDTILMLLPIVGTPLAQAIVDKSILAFDSIMINSPAETSFSTNINGLISETGPFDSQIAFPAGSTVSWVNGDVIRPIGQIAMPTVTAGANVGAPLALTNVPFAVADAAAMGDFVGYSLKAESFEWEVSATEMVVFAMGAPIPHINMKKRVTLKGFNGLSGLAINAFNLPSNDPDGIHLVLAATLPNPSSVGIELGNVSFCNIFQGQELGYVSTVGMSLQPNSVSPVNMAGTLVRQTSEAGLAALGDLFAVTLAGGSPSLTVKGRSVTPASGPVSWLSAAFASLEMNVSLPSIGKQNIITGVALKTMTLDFTGPDPYNIMTSSDNIVAQYQMPFTFPLNVSSVGQTMNLQLPLGSTVAVLSMPMSPAQTIANGVLQTGYTNQPLKVTESGRQTFQMFNKVLTTDVGVKFFLDGVVDTVADTAAGQVKIANISASVVTEMAGMNLNASPVTVTDISIAGGTAEYIEVKNNVILQNPSGLTVMAGDVTLDVFFGMFPMGKVIVPGMVLRPGQNTLPAVMQLQPPNAVLRDHFLSAFVAGGSFPLSINGTATSTPIEPLQMAMASIRMAPVITGITDKLIVDGQSKASPIMSEMLQMTRPRVTRVQIAMYNPFDADLYISHIMANNTWSGQFFGAIDQDVSLIVPAKSTIMSPPMELVSPKGPVFLLTVLGKLMVTYPSLAGGDPNLVPFDISSVITAKIGGASGYEANVQYAQLQTNIVIQAVSSYDTVPSAAPVVATPAATTAAPSVTVVAPSVTVVAATTTTTEAPVVPTVTAAPVVETATASPSPVTTDAPAPSNVVTPFSFDFLKRQLPVEEDIPFTGTDDEAVTLFKQMVSQACASVGVTPLF